MNPQQYLDEGYTPEQIVSVYGEMNPDAGISELRKEYTDDQILSVIGGDDKLETGISGLYDAFTSGLSNSSTGLAYHALSGDRKMPEQFVPQNGWQEGANIAGSLVGDIPEFISGSIGGSAVGGVSSLEVGGVPGAVLGGGAGAFALPAAIKEASRQKIEHGKIVDYGKIAKEAGIEGIIGAATSLVGGKIVEKGMTKAARKIYREAVKSGNAQEAFNELVKSGQVNKIVKNVIAPLGEVATFTSLGAAREGRVPTAKEFETNAASILGMHIGSHVAGKVLGIAKGGDSITSTTSADNNADILSGASSLKRKQLTRTLQDKNAKSVDRVKAIDQAVKIAKSNGVAQESIDLFKGNALRSVKNNSPVSLDISKINEQRPEQQPTKSEVESDISVVQKGLEGGDITLDDLAEIRDSGEDFGAIPNSQIQDIIDSHTQEPPADAPKMPPSSTANTPTDILTEAQQEARRQADKRAEMIANKPPIIEDLMNNSADDVIRSVNERYAARQKKQQQVEANKKSLQINKRSPFTAKDIAKQVATQPETKLEADVARRTQRKADIEAAFEEDAKLLGSDWIAQQVAAKKNNELPPARTELTPKNKPTYKTKGAAKMRMSSLRKTDNAGKYDWNVEPKEDGFVVVRTAKRPELATAPKKIANNETVKSTADGYKAKTIEQQNREDVMARPDYQVVKELRKNPIDLSTLRKDYDSDTINQIRKKFSGVFKNGTGTNLDEIASENGFSSGDQLIEHLKNLPTKEIAKLNTENMQLEEAAAEQGDKVLDLENKGFDVKYEPEHVVAAELEQGDKIATTGKGDLPEDVYTVKGQKEFDKIEIDGIKKGEGGEPKVIKPEPVTAESLIKVGVNEGEDALVYDKKDAAFHGLDVMKRSQLLQTAKGAGLKYKIGEKGLTKDKLISDILKEINQGDVPEYLLGDDNSDSIHDKATKPEVTPQKADNTPDASRENSAPSGVTKNKTAEPEVLYSKVKDDEKDQRELGKSQDTTPTPLPTTKEVKQELTARLGRKALRKLGVKVVQSINSIPAGIRRMVAWHGSPHVFDEFSNEHMGSGEGAQAFGHGLYFAGDKAVAEFYRSKLSDDESVFFLYGDKYTSSNNGWIAEDGGYIEYDDPDAVALDYANDASSTQKAANKLKEEIKAAEKYGDEEIGDGVELETAKKALKVLEENVIEYADPGALYKVELAPKEEEYLLWDKPLSKQSEFVQGKIKELVNDSEFIGYLNQENGTRPDFKEGVLGKKYQYKKYIDQGYTLKEGVLHKPNGDVVPEKAISEQLKLDSADVLYRDLGHMYRDMAHMLESDASASYYLHSLGIRGIKYLDGSSRSDGEGSYNYVIFNDSDISIKDVFYSKDGKVQGYYDPKTKQTTLIADNIKPGEAYNVALHEFIHQAKDAAGSWSGVFGKSADKIVKSIKMSIKAKSPAWLKAEQKAKDAGTPDKHLFEETVSYFMADKANAKLGLWKRIKTAVRSFMFRHGITKAISNDDIVAIAENELRRAAKRGVGGVDSVLPGNPDIRYSKAPADQIKSIAAKQAAFDQMVSRKKKIAAKFSNEKVQELIDAYHEARAIIADGQQPALKKMLAFKKITRLVPIDVKGKMLTSITAINKAYKKTQDKFFDKAIESLDVAIDKKLVNDGVNATKKLVKSVIKRKGTRLKGGAGGYATDLAIEAKKILTMSQDNQAAFVESLNADTPDVTVRAAMLVAGLKQRSPMDVLKAYTELHNVLAEGKAEFENREKKRKARVGAIKDRLIEETTGTSDFEVESSIDRLERENRLKTLRGSLANKADNFSNTLQSWDFAIDKIANKSGKATLKSDSVIELSTMVYEAQQKESKLQSQDMDNIQKVAKRIFKTKNVAKALGKNAKVDKNANITDSSGRKMPLSQSTAYPIWMLWQDKTLRERLVEYNDIDENTIKQIEDFMTPETRAWAEWQINDYYKNNYDKLNNVYERMFGANLPQIENYSPSAVINSKGTEDGVTLGQNTTPHTTMFKGMMNVRVDHKNQIKIKNGDVTLMQHVADTNHFVAWAETVRDLRSIFSDKKTKSAILSNVPGANMGEIIDNFIDTFATQGSEMKDTIPPLDWLRKNFNTAAVGGNPLIMIKQLTSIPAYSMEMPVDEWVKYSARFWRNPLKALDEIVKTDYAKSRMRDGWERDARAQMVRDKTPGDVFGKTKNLRERSMILTKLGDMAAVVIGGWPLYKYHYDLAIKEGKSPEMAAKIADSMLGQATARTQQAPHAKDLGYIQRGGSALKLATMFLTAPLSYTRQVQAAERNWHGNKADSAKRMFVAGVVLPALFSSVGALPALLSDDDDRKKEAITRLALDTATGTLNGIPLAREVVNMLKSSAMHDRWGSDVQFTPAFSNIEKVGYATREAFKEDPDTEKALNTMIDAVISLTGLNYKQGKNFVESWYKLADGEIDRDNWWRLLGYSKSAVGEK